MGLIFSSFDKRKVYPDNFENEGYRALGKNERVKCEKTIRGSIIIEGNKVVYKKRQI